MKPDLMAGQNVIGEADEEKDWFSFCALHCCRSAFIPIRHSLEFVEKLVLRAIVLSCEFFYHSTIFIMNSAIAPDKNLGIHRQEYQLFRKASSRV